MWPHPDLPSRAHRAGHRAGVAAILLIASLLAMPAGAESGLLGGSLGRWLDSDVLPELGETLGEHPRFKGETIRVVSLDGGQPTDHASRLHQAVQAHLTQNLLRKPGVRIAWTDRPETGCGVRTPPAYLLGVEIERDGAYDYRLNIRMIDVAESIWVSGVSYSWQGRLTGTEQTALRQAVHTAPQGTVDSPMPASSSREIAEIMHRHLRCAHPDGLDGPLYVENADAPDLNRVLASLNSELATAPLAALTSDRDNARWVLSLAAREAGASTGTGGVMELDLLLTEADRSLTQQVATVYMTRGRAFRATPPDIGPANRHVALLSEMRVAPAADEGICDTRKARGNQCAEVTFDLNEEAYLFVLASSNRRLSSSDCESRPVTARPGERRYRVRVPPSASPLPDAGVYAIAVTDPNAARDLAQHIRTGVCSRPMSSDAHWLEALDALLARHPGAIEWRAVHLANAPNGVARL